MKRPEGFEPGSRHRLDGVDEPPAPPGDEERDARAKKPIRLPAIVARRGSRAGRDVTAASPDPLDAADSTGSAGSVPASPEPGAGPAAMRSSGEGPPVPQPPDLDVAGSGAGRSRGAAAAARRAARRRRRYERSEVRRFTRRSRRRRILWALGLGSVATVVLLVVGAVFSPVMAVRTIDVEGVSDVDAGAVRAALGDQLGRPLALVDFAGIERDLSAFPRIESYSTQLRPPGTLVIHLVERTAVAVVAAGSSFHLVDSAGVVLSTSSKRPSGFPLIKAEPGTRGFSAATAVLGALPKSVRAEVVDVKASTKDDVSFTVKSGVKVVWGDPSRSEFKGTVLTELLEATGSRHVSSIDVSSPDSPVTR